MLTACKEGMGHSRGQVSHVEVCKRRPHLRDLLFRGRCSLDRALQLLLGPGRLRLERLFDDNGVSVAHAKLRHFLRAGEPNRTARSPAEQRHLVDTGVRGCRKARKSVLHLYDRRHGRHLPQWPNDAYVDSEESMFTKTGWVLPG